MCVYEIVTGAASQCYSYLTVFQAKAVDDRGHVIEGCAPIVYSSFGVRSSLSQAIQG